jgi:hypothetical protein
MTSATPQASRILAVLIVSMVPPSFTAHLFKGRAATGSRSLRHFVDSGEEEIDHP